MSNSTEILFSNNWNVRVSDPGEEGTYSHLFETVTIALTLVREDVGHYFYFSRRIEQNLTLERKFTDLTELFKFLADYLDPVALGLLGVKIGKLDL